VQTDFGIFLFEPLDLQGAVRRCFVPRQVYRQLRLGKLTGESLVDEQLVSTAVVAAALEEQRRLRETRLGEILVARHIVSAEQLGEAIEAQGSMPAVRIGEALTTLGYITTDQLGDALAQQQTDRSIPLGELLVRMGRVSRQDLQTALARKMGYPLVDVVHFQVDAEATRRLPYPIAMRRVALPLMLHGQRLVIAMEDPTQQQTIDEIEFATQCKVVPVIARPGELLGAIEAAYERVRKLAYQAQADDLRAIPFDSGEVSSQAPSSWYDSTSRGEGNSVLPGDDAGDAGDPGDNSVVRLVNTMILDAEAQRVSDIHVETQAGQDKVRIRFRKDGRLRPYMDLPHSYQSTLIARLKIMCELDISERRKPQDGKIVFGRFVPGATLELRVVTVPTSNGLEDMVLRLLAAARPLPLEQLGLAQANLDGVKAAIDRPHGLFLCVGPTGSGKTTTLHSALGCLNTPERKIWTAEDPIEISQPGLRQIQVHPKIGWTFAKALRTLLRADPDVVMVGEIRDQETAQIAVEASLTGHMVLSTLHTNSAAETITRLLDLGLDPFNFADSLVAVLAQRLVRKLCMQCRERYDASQAQLEELASAYLRAQVPNLETLPIERLLHNWRRRHADRLGHIPLYQPVGCHHCGGSGYDGRAGLHELMNVTRELRQFIQTGRRTEDLQRLAIKQGMRTLRQDGIKKVLGGLTTFDEVRGATG
jgi:type II secretory ATPase GspE/PulE/Tfp pilus assembly ATPase PilB-like protein